MTPDQLTTGNSIAKELQFLYTVRAAIAGATCITLGQADPGKLPFKLGNYFNDLYQDGGAVEKQYNTTGAVTFNLATAARIASAKEPQQFNEDSKQSAAFVLAFDMVLESAKALALAQVNRLIAAKEKEFENL